MLFIRYDLARMPELSRAHNGKGGLVLTVFDPVLQMPVTLSPDLVVLASGVVPTDNKNCMKPSKSR